MLEIVTIPVTVFYQNCRLLIDREKNEAIACDVGECSQTLINYINTHKLTLKGILLTHGHLDHVGGAKALAEIFNCEIIGPHKDDTFLFETLDEQAYMFRLNKCENYLPKFVEENDEIELIDGYKFKVIHTPGHTPGGVCFYCQSENIVLVGDTLFQGSIGRTDFPRGNIANLLDSIKNKLFILPDNTHVLPGHEQNTTIGDEKIHNPYVQAI